MDLNDKEMVFAIKIIDPIKVFTKKKLLILLYKIDHSNIYIIMALIN